MDQKFSDSNIADINWVEYFDSTKQRPYYYNKDDKTTVWKLPPAYASWKEDEIQKYCRENNIISRGDNIFECVDTITGEKTDCSTLISNYKLFLTATALKRKSKRKTVETSSISQTASSTPTMSPGVPSMNLSTQSKAKADSDAHNAIKQQRQNGSADELALRIPLDISSKNKQAIVETTPSKDIAVQPDHILPEIVLAEEGSSSVECSQLFQTTAMDVVVDIDASATTAVAVHEVAELLPLDTAEVVSRAKEKIRCTDSIMNIDISDSIQTILQDTPTEDVLIPTITTVVEAYSGYAQAVKWTLAVSRRVYDLLQKGKHKSHDSMTPSQSQSHAQSHAQSHSQSHPHPHTQVANHAPVSRLHPSGSHPDSSIISPSKRVMPGSGITTEADPFDSESLLADSTGAYIKEHFNVDKADALISKMESIPMWLEQLIEDKKFRCMLLELHEMHKKSALLALCVRHMSHKGYHRYSS